MYYAKYYGRGLGNNRWGKNKKLRVGEKIEKGKRKRGENYIKNKEKGPKNAFFLGYKIKK